MAPPGVEAVRDIVLQMLGAEPPNMPAWLQVIVIAAILGTGLIAGLMFAFSVAVIRALEQLAPDAAMFAMQRINVLIVNPLFLTVFLGTALLCLAVVGAVIGGRAGPAAGWLACGACAYLLGPVGITMACNVPLNNRLASVDPADASLEWPRYVHAWLRWNHLRTAIGACGVVLLAAGLAAVAFQTPAQ